MQLSLNYIVQNTARISSMHHTEGQLSENCPKKRKGSDEVNPGTHGLHSVLKSKMHEPACTCPCPSRPNKDKYIGHWLMAGSVHSNIKSQYLFNLLYMLFLVRFVKQISDLPLSADQPDTNAWYWV